MFYPVPRPIAFSAEVGLVIEGSVSGDSIVCQRVESYDGPEPKVTLTVWRSHSDGTYGRVVCEEIHDTDEHRFLIP